MIRLTELKLPLDHAPDALRDAVLARLAIPPHQLGDGDGAAHRARILRGPPRCRTAAACATG